MKLLFTLALLTASASAQVTLSPLFTDHAVLQRNKPIQVWGTAAPGEPIQVSLAADHVRVTADAAGQWHATLDKLPAGGPFELKANDAVAHDILIGEVWIASGQSNMEFHVNEMVNPPAILASADHPQLRMFTVPHTREPDPAPAIRGSWQVSTPTTTGSFSAVGYYFALSLFDHLHVPIGIIHSSWGGTQAEPWTPLPILLADPVFADRAKQQSEALRNLPADLNAYTPAIIAWESRYNAAEPPAETFDQAQTATNWKPITLPVANQDLPFKGAAVVWLRRTVTLPATFPSVRSRLELGQLLERNTVYVNQKSIGGSGYGAPELGTPNRSYDIAPGLLHPGENSIVIRAFAHSPQRMALGSANAFISAPNGQPAQTATGPDRYPLTGPWEYRLAFDQPLTPEALAALPHTPNLSPDRTPGALYNGMIFPLRNLPIAGAIWYQGESNAGDSPHYPGLMSDLITGWRKQFGFELPFYIVQLPVYQDRNFVPMRAAEAEIARTVPNTAIAVTIDTGDVTNIHPKNKQPVGERLALLALHRTYSLKLEDCGPFFASAKPEGSKLRITFTHAEGLHASNSGAIPNFELAGPDGNFLPADAKLDGQSILLSNPAVSTPTAARYAWSPTPLGCDLYNAANLPLAPFKTS